MHRTPIKLNEPSYTWDRSLPDYVLFEKALNTANVNDMIKTIKRIEYETDAFERYRNIAAMNDFNDALSMLHRQDDKSALLLFERVILQAPRDGFALPLSLRMRGDIFYKQNRFDGAANDFELLLYMTCYMVDNITEIYAKLVVCYYMLGKYDKAKESYDLYSRHLPELDRNSANGSRMHSTDYETEMLTATVEKLYKQIEHQHTTPPPIKKENYAPVFWTSLVSENSSSKDGETNRLYSSTNLPANTMVFQEKPAVRVLGVPWIQCDYCLELREIIYTCFDCRVKAYCGVDCLRSDYLHEEECKGLRYLIVLMLNSQQLYKAFIDLAHLIKHHILVESGLRRMKTARDVLIAIRLCAKDFNIPLLRILAQECDYTTMTDIEFSTVIASTLRLAIFIVEKTSILEEFRHAIELSSKQELILVGALLMQLQFYLRRDTYLFTFDIPQKRAKILQSTLQLEEKMREIGLRISPRKNYQNVMEYYYLNDDLLKLKINANLTHLENAVPKKPPFIDSNRLVDFSHVEDYVIPMLEYCDFISTTVLQDQFINDCDSNGRELSRFIARMNYTDQTIFLNMYIREFIRLFYDFFSRKRISTRGKPVRQMLILLGRELHKFRHSCDPNIELIFLTNGFVIGKTLKPVRKGDECFVSFRTRYYIDNPKKRMNLLQRYNVHCECIYCRIPSKYERYAIHANIYCVPSCRKEFGFMDEYCPKCGRDYKSILQQYANKLAELDTQCCNTADDREIHKHWIVLDKVSEQLFPSYHDYRIMQKLKYAKFIAMNNFFTQSCDMVRSVYADIKKYYVEESVLFTFYPIIIEIFTLLQYYNIDRGLRSAPPSKLREINKLGSSLLHAQLTNLRIYEKFDQNVGTILFSYRLFCKWKERMILMEVDVEKIEKLLPKESRIPGLEKNRRSSG